MDHTPLDCSLTSGVREELLAVGATQRKGDVAVPAKPSENGEPERTTQTAAILREAHLGTAVTPREGTLVDLAPGCGRSFELPGGHSADPHCATSVQDGPLLQAQAAPMS